MRAAGIIVEYNPFHNGHLYQVKKIRHELHPDVLIAVMSGDFTQRGEPAIISKWQRTKMALAAGVDLIIELPYIYAVGRADTFAGGAVALLSHLKVSHLVFGSELGRIAPFLNSIEQVKNHRKLYQDALAAALSQGISYPNAHAAAYQAVISESGSEFVDLRQPNNSLGFHYIQAIHRNKSSMAPVTFKRKEAGHNDAAFDPDASIASASSIRRCLFSGSTLEQLRGKLPETSLSLLIEEKKKGRLVDWETFFPYLKYRILSSSADQLGQIVEAEEGVENRLLKYIGQSETFEQFLSLVKTKRYTWVRIQRLCTHILTHTLKSEAKEAAVQQPAYLRLLGMSATGQHYLSELRKSFAIPLIAKIRQHHPEELTPDLRAAQIYDFLSGRSGETPTETGHPPVRYGS